MAIWFDKEPWYAEQKERWLALEAAGWKFTAPPPQFNKVGIAMERWPESYRTFVSKGDDPKTIHTKLLERCEHFAKGTVS